MSEQKQDGLTRWRTHPWRGAHLFAENRNKFPPEELLKYNHKYVAWYPDGGAIYDSDPDPLALWARLEASGDDPAWYCIEYITEETYV
jgi:hypothetical protein